MRKERWTGDEEGDEEVKAKMKTEMLVKKKMKR
jgi:hypothetical protein